LNTGVFFLFYHFRLNNLKNNSAEKIDFINSGIHDENAVVVKISRDELNNPEIFKELSDCEFIYRGSLYDLASSWEKGDTLYIICIHDIDEETFDQSITGIIDSFCSFKKLFRLNTNSADITLNQLLPCGVIIFPPNNINIIFPGNEQIAGQNINDIPSPPPKTS